MRRGPLRRKPEPTIALINIVFLMLVFFMVAGTLAPPLDPDVTLVDTTDLEGRAPPDALVIGPDGRLRFRGETVDTVQPYVQALDDRSVARVVPDRATPAAVVLSVSRQLRETGAERVLIVTRKALQ